ncbi:1-(5-phosphoribosyl)-5-[(5-phosphoribosylamino)methylideneamino]imidazole-4-carboxamide isomerase [Ferviditalea candida]|uniref:1-(5-phosphoribosyl)-5-[(5-phosphoribosylamino)methylideneamino] imidazole-4-carboxamide isomerase n=1 Tax=Ferviditalea candida TaxID=3108399 RepID=A0ABU5ZKX3_9BACL|nr:1-(5-phosphoribosyl)-5-[(5-phosphoribosylamino)methylideneamino]imidazole-4-carboxamide isomerase [Paenibacillaceae bacterium T2]
MSSFIIYPAIDIRGGKCVRLVQGDYNRETVYNDNPVEVARQWKAQGAEWIHLVDLDGAKAGHPVNEDVIGEIARSVDIPVQVGGGLRTREDVERLLSKGVSRVILGTAAIENRDFVQWALAHHGDQTAVGIDARDGYVATRGWLETSQIKAVDLAVELAAQGAQTFIFTDISRDGMMGGPNVESIVGLAKVSGRPVIASGGVSQSYDLLELARHKENGVAGAIVGKALYTGSLRLAEALEMLSDPEEQ